MGPIFKVDILCLTLFRVLKIYSTFLQLPFSVKYNHSRLTIFHHFKNAIFQGESQYQREHWDKKLASFVAILNQYGRCSSKMLNRRRLFKNFHRLLFSKLWMQFYQNICYNLQLMHQYYQIIIKINMIRTLRNLQRLSSIRDRIKLERESRLNKGTSAQTLTTKTLDDIEKIRNIGIIAHIDAGKTTTTQRMLYYAGALPSPGQIDEGTTTMDYLVQERERGITIRSAAISFNWRDEQINLIDTPGHVDFSGEVTRSLQVLDGAVTILDAVKGVQSQTKKVWAHATKHHLPKICYLNKMDRIGASIPNILTNINKKLNTTPLLLQDPIGDGEVFKGIVDVIEMEEVLFKGKYGEQLVRSKIPKNTDKHNHYTDKRNEIIEAICDFDDDLANKYLSDETISAFQIKRAIRNVMISLEHRHKISPVLLGSSFKNKGVQLLLDSVCDYLPSPKDRYPIQSCDSVQTKARQPSKDEPFTAYVFKVLYDAEKGPLAYTRIFSGKLDKHQEVHNSTKNIPEKIHSILRVRSNQYVPLHSIGTGDIVALTGFSETSAGDTLTLGSDQFKLPVLDVPTPVFTAPFQLTSNKYFREFDEAMKRAVTQDDSLTFKYQTQTNQYLVSGLGELHLQILKDRLKGEGIPIKMGELKINFKETVNKEAKDTIEVKNEIKPMVFEECILELAIFPRKTDDNKVEEKNQILFMFEKVPEFDPAWSDFLLRKAIKENRHMHVKSSNLHSLKKTIRNPTPIEPLFDEDEDEDMDFDLDDDEPKHKQNQSEDEPYYHINTLPFETLYELAQSCKTALLYGKNNLPTNGIQIQILHGKYKKSSFSKALLNKCASQLTRKLIEKTSVVIEPIMEFTLTGEDELLDIAVKDILKKRGYIQSQQDNTLTGTIPAQGVRGWIKQLRSMGLEIELKFSGYNEVTGISSQKLLQKNM